MSFFACCFRRRARQSESQHTLHEPPEISWENTLGAPNGVPFDDATKELLRDCLDSRMPAPTTLTEIIKRSEGFPVPFPVNTVRCRALRDRGIGMDTLELNANSVYPLIHEATLPLIAGWLKYKRLYGSAIERKMYKDMGLVQFIQRLLEKRSVQFYGSDDRYVLIDGKSGAGGWENVGTEREKEPLVLASCLSYDEIKLSATIIVSSHTEFINDGSRENRGAVCDDPDSIQPRGVIMGVVGTRFEKPRVMEYQDILITHLQNNMDNGYGPPVEGTSEEKRGLRCVWSRFFGEDYHPLYEEAVKRAKQKENRRYIPLTGQIIFDAENYMKRILMSVEMILLEANTRAEKQNTTAFLHVVGFGLGVWKIIHDQEIYFLKTFEIALRKMNKKLKYVSDIMFSYFRQQKCGGAGNGDYLGDIRIHFALREPQTKLFRSSDANKLLIVTYAADGNSFPGNEFWGNYLTASGDPAAACSTQIAELHNPRINPRACGASLHVASPEHGVVHIGDYAKLHLTIKPRLKGQIGPLGTDQQTRRPSRSPRSQRSRSADVDLLKKYTERKIELRRHTEAGETSRWIPLAKSTMRAYLPTKDHTVVYTSTVSRARSGSEALEQHRERGHDYYNPLADTPSPRHRSFSEQETIPENGKVKWLPTLTRIGNYRSDSYANDEEQQRLRLASRQGTGRSLSADVGMFRRDSLSRWNERYVNFSDHGRLISYKWMPETGISMSRYIPSPLARRTSEGSSARLAGAANTSVRWMTYTKIPSPCPIQRKLSDRRPSSSEQTGKNDVSSEPLWKDEDRKKEDEEQRRKRNDEGNVCWQPQRKFSPAPKEDGSQKATAQGNQDDTVPDVNRVKQRLRELYDFKIETEWPKRIRNPSRETLWDSKRNSEEDKLQPLKSEEGQQERNYEPRMKPVRRNSQDLEFNDRIPNKFNNKSNLPPKPISRKLPEVPKFRRDSSSDQVFETINRDNQRPRNVYNRLRYSEDYGKQESEQSGEVIFEKVSLVRDRRTYSDDYENPSRREPSDGSVASSGILKRYSDSITRYGNYSRPSYAESESSSSITRNSRLASDASYASIGSSSYYTPLIGKRGSIEYKSNTKRVEISHRRTMSQYDSRQKTTTSHYDTRQRPTTSSYEQRPRTPVPPPEIEDLYRDFRSAGKTTGFSSRQRRNSTRYKVYLT